MINSKIKLFLLTCYFVAKVINFSGTIKIDFPEMSQALAVSSDGNIFIVQQYISKALLVYRNNGTGFEYMETLQFNIHPGYVVFSNSNQLLLVRSHMFFMTFQTQNFTLIQNISSPQGYILPAFSKDESRVYLPCNGKIVIYEKVNNFYQFSEEIVEETFAKFTVSENKILFAGSNLMTSQIFIYEQTSNYYSLKQIIQPNGRVLFLQITDGTLMFILNDSMLYEYKELNGEFSLKEMTGVLSGVSTGDMTEDLSILYMCSISYCTVVEKTSSGYVITETFVTGSYPFLSVIDPYGHYFMASFANLSVVMNFKCPVECIDCTMPNNCTACIGNYILANYTCIPEPVQTIQPIQPTYCVKNIFIEDNICEEYCSHECKTCNQTKYDCVRCEKFHTKNSDGKCVLNYQALDFARRARFFLNLIRRRALKFVLLAIDDLYLYSFHKRQYDGIMREIIDIIKVIEEKQWQLVGLSEVKEHIQRTISDIKEYNPYSNERYMEEKRENNVFFQSTVDFFFFFLPVLIISTFLLNRLFYLLFNYRISIIFRPFSLWWILFELSIQNNIEYFTFLGFRALTVPFSFNFFSKGLFAFTLIVFFLVIFSVFSSYGLYYGWYGKLARYFLVNMYRFPTSYALMIIIYGIRPFMKGITHALLHEQFFTQLHILSGIDILMIIIILTFEYCFGNHKSKKVLVCQVLYMTFFVAFNVLFLLKYQYLTGSEEQMESYLILVAYCLLVLLVLRVLFDIFDSIEWKEIRATCCRKMQPAVAPSQNRQPDPSMKEPSKDTESSPSDTIEKDSNLVYNFYKKKFRKQLKRLKNLSRS